jgi:cell division protein FtsA
MRDLAVALDVGTRKICAVVAEVRPEDIFVVGIGIEPSAGMRKGVVTDMGQLTAAISAAVHKAEKSSGFDIARAYVSVAGSHIASVNSRGAVGITGTRGVNLDDLDKAMDQARAIAIPHNREVLHVIPRSYSLDGQERVRSPLGMHGFRLEVEAHIITASSTSVANLEQSVQAAGVSVDRFILNPLASGEAVLTEQEREMGVVVIDIGGGTTDLAMFIEGTVWHTAVIAVGGDLITNDITHWMRVPFDVAEAVKLHYGHALQKAVDPLEMFLVEPFGEGMPTQVSRHELADVIQMRVAEMFDMVRKEIKRSGYGELLRAGAVITGGCAQLPGLKEVAAQELGCPVRIARPEKLTGMADALRNPSYSTSVGLLRMGLSMEAAPVATRASNGSSSTGSGLRISKVIGGLFKRLLPDGDE